MRICDTRAGNPSNLAGSTPQCNTQPLGPGTTSQVNVSFLAGVPSNATAVVVNLTGVAPSAAGFLTVFSGATQPTTSDLNQTPGAVGANLVVATINANGTISIFTSAGTTIVHVDVLGWYP